MPSPIKLMLLPHKNYHEDVSSYVNLLSFLKLIFFYYDCFVFKEMYMHFVRIATGGIEKEIDHFLITSADTARADTGFWEGRGVRVTTKMWCIRTHMRRFFHLYEV